MSTGGSSGNGLNTNSFASAATGLKASSNPNVKISSAELLSMLKKPTGPMTTSIISNPNGTSNAVTSAAVPETMKIIPPFKDDDYTLQGLINLIKACQNSDRNIFALGVDLENDIGLAMNQEEPLRHSLLSPWYDEGVDIGDEDRRKSCGLLGLEGSFPALDSIIPSCYLVPSLPSSITKITSFADETLFYIFYAMPGDRMQELSARELFSRGWRFFKPTKSWVCPVEAKDLAGQFKAALSGPVNFYVFDQSAWIKVKRALTLQHEDLEFSRPTNSGTASPISSPEVMHGSGTLHSTSVTH